MNIELIKPTKTSTSKVATLNGSVTDPHTLIKESNNLVAEAAIEAITGYPDFMTVEQVASVLQLSHNTVRSLLNQHIIPGKKLSHKWIIPRESLAKALIDA